MFLSDTHSYLLLYPQKPVPLGRRERTSGRLSRQADLYLRIQSINVAFKSDVITSFFVSDPFVTKARASELRAVLGGKLLGLLHGCGLVCLVQLRRRRRAGRHRDTDLREELF